MSTSQRMQNKDESYMGMIYHFYFMGDRYYDPWDQTVNQASDYQLQWNLEAFLSINTTLCITGARNREDSSLFSTLIVNRIIDFWSALLSKMLLIPFIVHFKCKNE